jgi:hypothetical protein
VAALDSGLAALVALAANEPEAAGRGWGEASGVGGAPFIGSGTSSRVLGACQHGRLPRFGQGLHRRWSSA